MRRRMWTGVVALFVTAAVGCDGPQTSGTALPTVPTTIEGAPPASVLLCDTQVQTASLADDGRVVVAHSVGWLDVDRLGQLTETSVRETHQLVRVRDGHFIATRHRNPGAGPHWGRRFDESTVVSFSTGATVDLPGGATRVTTVGVDGDSFWAVFRDSHEQWQFTYHTTGSGWQHHAAPAEPHMPVAQHGMLWAQTSDCALLRMSPAGGTTCIDKRAPGISKWVKSLGPSHLQYGVTDGESTTTSALNTSSLERVDLGCPDAKVRSWVEEPFAVVMKCDGGGHRLWSNATGAISVEPNYPPDRWPAWESKRFLSVSADHYFDAMNGQVVRSTDSLLWVTPDGDDYARKVEYPCPGMSGEVHEYGQWRIATCIEQTTGRDARRLRGRARTINSCTSPGLPPTRITAHWLIDNKAARVHKISGMKIIGLTEHGIVGIQGSGHDLDEQDGVRIVLQPYPPSEPDPARKPPEFVPIDEPPEITAPSTYRQAYYEYLCIFERLKGDPDQLQAYDAVFERHGLSEGHSTRFSNRLDLAEQFQIRRRVEEECTADDARRFGTP